jgi:hypothetical protein
MDDKDNSFYIIAGLVCMGLTILIIGFVIYAVAHSKHTSTTTGSSTSAEQPANFQQEVQDCENNSPVYQAYQAALDGGGAGQGNAQVISSLAPQAQKVYYDCTLQYGSSR